MNLCYYNKYINKRMKIKRAPNILALHLKRFKYEEKLNRYVKLPYRVLFPTELRLSNMVYITNVFFFFFFKVFLNFLYFFFINYYLIWI